MQHIDKLGLFSRNATGVLKSGYQEVNAFDKDNSTNAILSYALWMMHTLFLPVTVPTGATVKTLIDVISRDVIPDDQIAKMKETIKELDDHAFDLFVLNISKYQPKSHASEMLLKDLTEAENRQKKKIESTKITAENRIRKIYRESMLKNKGMKLSENILVLGKSTYSFSPEELKQIENEVEIASASLVIVRRKEQRNAITSYLDDNKNIGKKMEHVIQDNLSRSI